MRKIVNENTFIDDNSTLSFGCDNEYSGYQGYEYHVHPEMELMAMDCVNGSRMINEHIEQFENNDVIFIPGGIPHGWKVDEVVPRGDSFTNSKGSF